jgi:hypothetical protein
MAWFHKVNGPDMLWQVDNEECLDVLREMSNANYQEKAVIAKSDSHHVVFFEGEGSNGGVTLFEASMSPDGKELNTQPIKTTAGSVENVFEFSDQWNSVSVEETPPIVLTE